MTGAVPPLLCAAGAASLCALALGCSVRSPRIVGEGIPCSGSSDCDRGETCFLGECRGTSTALGTVLAEVRPPPGAAYGVLQAGSIDLRQSVLVDFTLEPALGVAGEVEQALEPAQGSSPVTGASITFAGATQVIPGRQLQINAQVSSDGLFTAALPAGSWDATVVPPSPLPPLYSTLALDTGTPALQFLLPASGELLRVQGQISAGSAPLAGARVLAVDSNGQLLAAAASADATGAFQLVLPPDAPAFDLRVGPASDASGPGGAAATQLPSYAAVGPFPAGSALVSWDFGPLPAAATLSGSVVDSAGAPVAGARVYALSLDGQGYALSSSTLSDSQGAFLLALLAGQFAVEAAPASGDASAPGLSAEQDLQLAAGANSLTLVCPPRVQAQGHLLQADGAPAPAGTQISATRLPDRLVSGRVAQTQPSDAAGNFSILADSGSYRLSIVPPAASGLASQVAALDLEPGTPVLPTLQLAPPLQVVGTLLGASTGGAPAPIAGATVEFFALDASGQQAVSLGSGLTDSSGRYLAILPDLAQPAAAAARR